MNHASLTTRLRISLTCVVLLASCGRDSPRATPGPTTACSAGDDPFARQLAALLVRSGDHQVLADLFEPRPGSVDELIVALFPAAAGKPMVDRPLPAPAPYTGVIEAAFAPAPISFPVDWAANPPNDASWQLWFQSLRWLGRAELDVAAYAVVDWAEHALYVDPPLSFTWNDHAMAMRLRSVNGFAQRYIEQAPELNRRVLVAASEVVLVNLLALASNGCYVKGHNHGMMQDLAVLENVASFPRLRDGDQMRQVALTRARAQIAVSVTPDGVHVENSPHYHMHYVDLALRAVAASRSGDRPADPEIKASAEQLMAVLVQLLQPNLTLPQFGDTENDDYQAKVLQRVKRARELGLDPGPLDELTWLATRGAEGRMPERVDAIFEQGGYAVFREQWRTSDAASTITAHFRAAHASWVHYHPDETGIEIYGYGSELIIGPGVHGYDANDPFVPYQKSPAANNVLVVDDVGGVDKKVDPGARITAHGTGDALAWVQGTHRNYRDRGVELIRTFAYRKPDGFAVIDHVRNTGGEHHYAQHFHLHPQLSDVQRVGATVVAQTAGAAGPSVTLTPAAEARVEVELTRGIKTDAHVAGWHFPDKYQADPATDVVFRRTDDGAELDLPVLVLIAAPGEPPPIPADVTYREADGQAVLRWTIAGTDHSIAVPLPQ